MNDRLSQLIKISFFSFFCLGTFSTLSAQWSQTNGPQGGQANCVEKVGDQIWAASNYGVYVSDNEGASWEIHPEFTRVYCNDIMSLGDTIVVIYSHFNSSFDSPLYCRTSFDGGATWSLEIQSGSTSGDIAKIIRVQNTLYIDNLWAEYLVSYNFGISWSAYTTPYEYESPFYSVGENGFLMQAHSDVPPFYHQIYNYYNQQAATWIMVDSTHSVIAVFVKDNSIFFVVNDTDSYKIIRTDDYGTSWITVYDFPAGINPYTGDFVYFENAIYYRYLLVWNEPARCIVSTDDGQSWTDNEIAPPVLDYLRSNDYEKLSNNDYLFAYTYLGIARYDIAASSFFFTNTGFRGQNTPMLSAHNGILYTAINGYKTFKSPDGGSTWSELPLELSTVDNFVFRGDTIFGTSTYETPHLSRSFDNGATWDTINLPFYTNSFERSTIAEFNNKIYIEGDQNIMSSSDLGLTWSERDFDVLPDNFDHSGSLQIYNNELYVVTNDGDVRKYNEAADDWTSVLNIYSVGAYSGNKLYSMGSYLVLTGYAFRISANGSTWLEPQLNGIPLDEWGDHYHPDELVEYNGVWFGALGGFGVYYSSDHGNNWQQLQTPSPFSAYGGLTVLNGILFSGSFDSSVWRRSGPLAVISGNVYFDNNNNGIKDGNESDAPGLIVKTSPVIFTSTTDASGNYGLYTDASGDTLKAVMPTPYCTSNPGYHITNGAATDQNFGIYVTPGIHDLSTDLANVNVFRPGFETTLNLIAMNRGSVDQTAQLKLVLDNTLQFNSANPAADSQIGDTLVWNSATLSFLQSETITINVIASETAQNGDTVRCYAYVSPVSEDIAPDDNQFVLTSVYVGSFDPNTKDCLQGEILTQDQARNGKEIEYIIRFQNTGTFQADNIYIADTLSQYVDLSTFRIISGSHEMHYTMSGEGIVKFYFDNINLPDSNANEMSSHGFVKYAVKCKHEISTGNAITNTAYIYFDFNSPVVTNTTTTLITFPVVLATEKPGNTIHPNTIVVYPNPANDILFVDTRGISGSKFHLSVIDIKGSLIKSNVIINNEFQISLGGLPTGVYMGIIYNEKNELQGTFKFIHE